MTPLCEIIKNSSRCSKDIYSKDPRYMLTFNVRIWDRLTAEMVQTALNSKGFNASIDEILPLPMQMVRYLYNNAFIDIGFYRPLANIKVRSKNCNFSSFLAFLQ